MSERIIIITSFSDVVMRLQDNVELREQYQRECDALDRTRREPPPRTMPILVAITAAE